MRAHRGRNAVGEGAPCIRECRWHGSQRLEEQPDGSLLLTLTVAEPQEVARRAWQ